MKHRLSQVVDHFLGSCQTGRAIGSIGGDNGESGLKVGGFADPALRVHERYALTSELEITERLTVDGLLAIARTGREPIHGGSA